VTLTLVNKTIIVENIGAIRITKKQRNKRICIRVSNNSVKVSIPYYASFKEAEKFIFEKLDWINSTIIKIKENQPILNDSTEIPSLIGIIKINKSNETKKIKVNSNIQGYVIKVPHDYDFVKKQNELRKFIVSWLRKQAKCFLDKKTFEIAQKYSFTYNKIKISSANSRWGSCSNKNTICLNYRLLFLPEDLCNYIILHELMHTIHKNHSKLFWMNLFSIDEKAKEKDKRLKKFKIFQFI